MSGTTAAEISAAKIMKSDVRTITDVLKLLSSLSKKTEVNNNMSEEILDRYKMVFRKRSIKERKTDRNNAKENKQCEDYVKKEVKSIAEQF